MPHSPLSLSAPLWRLCLASRNNKVRITKEKQFVKRLSCDVSRYAHICPKLFLAKFCETVLFYCNFNDFLLLSYSSAYCYIRYAQLIISVYF